MAIRERQLSLGFELASSADLPLAADLPEGWKLCRLGAVCAVNPSRKGQTNYADDLPVTFVPMSAVDENTGTISQPELRPFGSVKKGYTWFIENDVLFAKITPCMQNGKAAIARHLSSGVGFGSTEFHVLRPDPDVLPEWVHFFIRQPSFRAAAAQHFTGSVGQQRVPESFMAAQLLPIPPLPEQRRIVARIEKLAARIEKARGLRRQAVEEVGSVLASAMNQVWSDASDWDRESLDKLVTLVSGQIDPRIEPYTSLPHINGEAIESGTCRLLPYRSAKEDAVTSGKYHFRAGSVLYSKIRPYLRKAVQVPVEGICSADVYAFNNISNALEPRFLMYSLVTQDFTEYANSLSNRARIPILNQEQLLAYDLPCPPLSEQRRIVAYLDGVQDRADVLRRLQAESAAELDALLPAVLERAFRGEL